MTNLENLKKLAEGLGADASGAETNAQAIGVVAEVAGKKIKSLEERMDSAEFDIPPYAFHRRTDYTGVGMNAGSHQVGKIGAYAFAFSGVTDANMYSVSHVGEGAFYDCKSLTKADMYAAKVLYEKAFMGCSKLSSFTSYELEVIGSQCFVGCNTLTTLSLPASLQSIGENAFQSCTSLTKISIAKPEGSIAGAPWGAPNATVTWTG